MKMVRVKRSELPLITEERSAHMVRQPSGARHFRIRNAKRAGFSAVSE
jgi:hypothetical protein